MLIVVAIAAAYANSFRGQFVFDDEDNITRNGDIRSLWPPGEAFGNLCRRMRPVTDFTLAVNYAFSRWADQDSHSLVPTADAHGHVPGCHEWSYHTFNLIVHVLAALVLFGIVRRTLLLPRFAGRFDRAAVWLALAVALLWGVHPLTTEAVTYIVQRAESLASLFFLLTLYCVIRGGGAQRRDGKTGRGEEGSMTRQELGDSSSPPPVIPSARPNIWHMLAVVACALGMGSKLVMVTAPVVVFLYDWLILSGSLHKVLRSWRLHVGLAATWVIPAALLFTVPAGATAGLGVQKFTPWTYLLTEMGVIAHYVRLAFAPVGLRLDYGWPAVAPGKDIWLIVPPAVLLIALAGLTVWAIVRRRAVAALGVFFFVVLAPTSSIVPIRDPAVEHRMYLPLAAVIAAVVVGLYALGSELSRRVGSAMAARIAAGAALGAAAAALAFLTVQRNVVYADPVKVWEDALAHNDKNARAWNNLGIQLALRGQRDRALDCYLKALEIEPEFSDAHNNVGNDFLRRDKPREAIAHYDRAIRSRPGFADAHFNKGLALVRLAQLEADPQLKLKRYDEAIQQYELSLRIEPRQPHVEDALGTALAAKGSHSQAEDHFRAAIELNGDFAEARLHLAQEMARRNDTGEAIDQLLKALDVRPGFFEALDEMGRVMAGINKPDQAALYFARAVAARPESGQAHYNLGQAFLRLGRTEPAIEELLRATELSPDLAVAYFKLGAICHAGGDVDAAIAWYRKAIKAQSDFAQAHYNLGLALQQADRGDEAISEFREALRCNPKYDDARKAIEKATGKPMTTAPTSTSAASTSPATSPRRD